MEEIEDFDLYDTIIVSEQRQNHLQGVYYKRYKGFMFGSNNQREVFVFNPTEMKLSQIYACRRRVYITSIRMVLTEKCIDKKFEKYKGHVFR